jgi:hypothetical protein
MRDAGPTSAPTRRLDVPAASPQLPLRPSRREEQYKRVTELRRRHIGTLGRSRNALVGFSSLAGTSSAALTCFPLADEHPGRGSLGPPFARIRGLSTSPRRAPGVCASLATSETENDVMPEPACAQCGTLSARGSCPGPTAGSARPPGSQRGKWMHRAPPLNDVKRRGRSRGNQHPWAWASLFRRRRQGQ